MAAAPPPAATSSWRQVLFNTACQTAITKAGARMLLDCCMAAPHGAVGPTGAIYLLLKLLLLQKTRRGAHSPPVIGLGAALRLHRAGKLLHHLALLASRVPEAREADSGFSRGLCRPAASAAASPVRSRGSRVHVCSQPPFPSLSECAHTIPNHSCTRRRRGPVAGFYPSLPATLCMSTGPVTAPICCHRYTPCKSIKTRSKLLNSHCWQ